MPKKLPARRCSQRSRKGDGSLCRFWAVEGSPFCRKHQHLKPGSLSPEHTAARNEGRRQWWAKIKEALAKGYIAKARLYTDDGLRNMQAVGRNMVRINAERRAAADAEALARRDKALPSNPRKFKPGRKSGPPKGQPLKPDHLKKMAEGRRLARERQRIERAERGEEEAALDAFLAAKKAETAKPPQPRLNNTEARALSNIITEKNKLPAVPDKPFEEMEDHQKLTVITSLSLDYARELLLMRADPKVDPKAAELKWRAAAGALAIRVKVDRNALAARRIDGLTSLIERLKSGKDDPLTIEN